MVYNLVADIPKEQDSKFQKWLDDANNPRSTRTTCYAKRGKQWFQDILTPRKWCSCEVIDSLVMFVRKKLELRLDLCRRKFTTGDRVLSNFLRRTDGVYACMQSHSAIASRVATEYDWEGRARTVLSYIDGTHSDYEKRWMDVDAVYLPYNIGGKHWVMICIDFEEGELIVWDSFMSMTPLSKLEVELKPMVTIIPALICRAGVHLNKPNIPLTPWRIRRVASAPQQDMGGDCGIFCVKFFEYDVTASSFDTLTQSKMSFFRRQFAVQLWANKSII